MKIKGYLNTVRKKGNTYIRTSKREFSNWKNEQEIYKKLGIACERDAKGTLTREWIQGKVIDKYSPEIREGMREAIEYFHSLSKRNITTHQWNAYDDKKNKVSNKVFQKFKEVRSSFNSEEYVVSHNDINYLNALWNGHEVILIDFEWANLNHPYFDYVQLYIADGVVVMNDIHKPTWDKVYFSSLVYFILWTYHAPLTMDVIKWRRKYKKLLKEFLINNQNYC